MLITPTFTIVRQKLKEYFEGYSKFYLKLLFIYSMISRGTPQYILHICGCQAPLHVHRHLTFCAMYNKHTAPVSTGHKAHRASAFLLSSVSQQCARGILTSRIWCCVEHTRTDCLCLSLLSVCYKDSLVITFQLLFCVWELVLRIEGGTEAECVRGSDPEADIVGYEGRSNRGLEKTT